MFADVIADEAPAASLDHLSAELQELLRGDAEWAALEADLEPPPETTRAPSGFLGVELDGATDDMSALSDPEVVEAIIGFERLAAWAGARQARLLAEFTRRRPGDDPQAGITDHASSFSRWAPDEVGLALSLSRLTSIARLAQSRQLTDILVDTLEAWEHGRIDASKVRAICDVCLRLPHEQAVAVQERVLDRAADQTLAQLKQSLKRAVIAVDPDGAADRHAKARRDRRVAMIPAEDGMATLWACLAAPDALTAYGWLTALARGLGRDDPRGMDARRADLLVALITGRLTTAPPAENTPTGAADTAAADRGATESAVGSETAAGSERAAGSGGAAGESAGPTPFPLPTPVNPGKPLVQVLVPLSTLTGADDNPVELVGYGPVPAPLAREIAADAVWKRLVTDPLSGALLDHGRTVYRPPAALADFVRARDVTCRFPPCRRRAIDTELDHTRAWDADEGETREENLYGGCPHHHHLKHDAPGWTVTQHPDGRIIWTTPTGHRYTSEPYDYRPEPAPSVPTGRAARPPKPVRRDILGRDLRLVDPLPDGAVDDAPF